MKKYIFILLILIISDSFSQGYGTQSKKAKKNYQTALKYYNGFDNENALKYINNAIKADDKYIDAYWFRAEIYFKMKDTIKCIENYEKAIEINPKYSYKLYYELAAIYYRIGNYKKANENYKLCKEFDNLSQRFADNIDYNIKETEFCYKSVENPVPYKPINMGNNVNTKFDDYWPLVTADEQILYTTKLIPIDNRFPVSERNGQEDFFYNKKVGDEWGQLMHIGKSINTPGNEGAPTISADGQWFYFTACGRKDGKGKCDIYKTKKIGNRWQKAINLGAPINTSAWESQPSVSADGRTLYFVSSRGGSKGEMDIWVSHLQENGQWTNPKNLGDSINTGGKEMSPFIHPDGKTLYFTSNAHMGFGDQDIFISRKNEKGEWSKAKNLGYPINTKGNERGIALNNRGDLAYISTQRGGKKDLDIYYFELYEEVRPTPSTYVTGKIYNTETKQPVYTEFRLENLDSAEFNLTNTSDEITGRYLVPLPAEQSYAFNITAKGYLFYSDNFTLPKGYDISKPFEKDIPLIPIKKDAKVVLKNIFFELDSYELKEESYVELNRLVKFIKYNSNIKVEIGGHTDNQGSAQHNKVLSENRAKTVYNYLIKKGIDKNKLSYKGYGMEIPIADNNTKEGRAKNRRTEAKIIQIN